jgi:hypothetical protein
MKNIFYIIIILTSLILLVNSCEKDNFRKPDAQFFGAIKDSVGGALIETEIVSGNTLGVTQVGLETPVLQTWYIDQSGNFRNDLVYSQTYDITFASVNFFPYSVKNMVINPGVNQVDFQVVPYIRIKNCQIINNVGVDSTITATFTLEPGKSTVKVSRVTLYAFNDLFVGNYSKFTIATGTGTPTITYSPAATINPSTSIKLSIDLKANRALFTHGKNYYFRVGAQASQSGVGTIRYNYIPYVRFSL